MPKTFTVVSHQIVGATIFVGEMRALITYHYVFDDGSAGAVENINVPITGTDPAFPTVMAWLNSQVAARYADPEPPAA